MAIEQEYPKTPKHKKIMSLILIISVAVLIIIIILISLSIQKKYSASLKTAPAFSPELNSSFCTNREKTASVCKGNVICQCSNETFTNPFFFANSNEKCPNGCNALKPASSEGPLGTCALALIIASDVPLCHPGCIGPEVTKKSEDLNNECCVVTMESPCSLAQKANI